MQDFNPLPFSARIALAALVAHALFTAPPAAAQDYRVVTPRVIGNAVSDMSAAKADPGSDQAGGTKPAGPEQAVRQEEIPPEPDAAQKGPASAQL